MNLAPTESAICGAGSTKNKPNETANTPYYYGLKEQAEARPRPWWSHTSRSLHYPSTYTHNKKVGLSAQLDPLQKLPNDRVGFLIHEVGPHGSDGCIVLADKDFHKLMNSLKTSHGGTLVVCQAADSVFI